MPCLGLIGKQWEGMVFHAIRSEMVSSFRDRRGLKHRVTEDYANNLEGCWWVEEELTWTGYGKNSCAQRMPLGKSVRRPGFPRPIVTRRHRSPLS